MIKFCHFFLLRAFASSLLPKTWASVVSLSADKLFEIEKKKKKKKDVTVCKVKFPEDFGTLTWLPFLHLRTTGYPPKRIYPGSVSKHHK